jgi:hypothetical protein
MDPGSNQRARGIPGTLQAMSESRSGLAALGAIICVALTLVVSFWWLVRDALPGQQHWATQNAESSYTQRTFPRDDLIGSSHVAEDARLWMPRTASYRIVVGESKRYSPWSWAAPNFLAGFLLPRTRNDAPDTGWIICLGCERSTLGPHFEALSDGHNGVVFGRVRH